MQERGYLLADLLDHVFEPSRKFPYDWRWRGFFAQKATVQRIFSHWTTSKYNKTTRTFVYDWAIHIVNKEAGKESRRITQSKILSKVDKPVNEEFFLSYDLAGLTERLRDLAPVAFGVFDAFSTTSRQLWEMSAKWFRKKRIMIGSAALSLLKGASQKNSFPQAVHSTYLLATGSQRQHFSVLSSLGITMGYTSVISQGSKTDAVNSGEPNQPSASNGDTAAPAHQPLITEVDANSDATQKKPKKRTQGTLLQLSLACLRTVKRLAATHLFSTGYDNVNFMIRIAEQILGRSSKCTTLECTSEGSLVPDAQENGTCGTIFPLHEAELKHMLTEDLNKRILDAPPLSIYQLQLTKDEAELLLQQMIHAILRIIIHFGGEGFKRWETDLEASVPTSLDTIEVHKTPVHPLPAMEIEENSITGNVEVMEAINKELGIDEEDPEYVKYMRIIAGDQLTIARQRSILNVRLGHEHGAQSWKNIVLMPGLFHAKIADCHGLLETHFGKPNAGTRSPGGLAFQNTCLNRLPILLSSLPSFRVCRDLIMVSLNARVLHCLLLVSGKKSLEDYTVSVNSWSTLKAHATQIYQQFADADHVQELRELRVPEEHRREAARKADKDANIPSGHVKAGNMVFENAVLFLRDALLTREFSDVIKRSDSGRVIIILKLWVFAYRRNGRTKYAHEMLHVLHNLINVWTDELRRIVTQNWLLNPTGKANAFVEIDLVQEHLNFWIKKIYKADGDMHSWDWLAMVSPCVDILRRLAARINADLGARH
ncbi:hypothetical protein Hypma_005341 [Hypsizygus marmoreus]|uniref:DUF6589 domain-containing protein n=1 Tax=Hypsizygus marmoreus TaxID=39966 RepID=A0A369JY81_HYPMA|nr:hypothetical protein Hypma_005341 [Hypsizygus marmoreus]